MGTKGRIGLDIGAKELSRTAVRLNWAGWPDLATLSATAATARTSFLAKPPTSPMDEAADSFIK